MKASKRQIGIVVGTLIIMAIFVYGACMNAPKAEEPPCPSPKPLSCGRLMDLATKRHCLPETPPCKAVPCDSTPCAPVPCTPTDCKPVDCKPTVVTAYVPMQPEPDPPTGKWLVGGGPLYSAGWGLTAVGGYQWPSGWQLLVGPTWVPRDDVSGSSGCAGGDYSRNGGHDSQPPGGCVPVGYTVPARSAWGGQALAVFAFK